MSIWNKILIGLILLASLGFLYFAARTLRTHQYWRDLADKLDKKVIQTREETRKIQEGEDESGKLKDGNWCTKVAEQELRRVLINRPRVWPQCEHPKPADAKGQVAISPAQGTAGILAKMTLYLFEESEPRDPAEPVKENQKDKARYLGEFIVTQVDDKSVGLQPAMSMTPRELKRLTESSSEKGTWIAWESMPVDRHDVFADMSEDDKKFSLPDATLDQYVRDGQAAKPEDPKECKVEEKDGSVKYTRLLRDYGQMFAAYHAERVLLADISEAIKRDLAFLKGDTDLQFKGALEDVQEQLTLAEKENTALVNETKAAAVEKQVVVNHQSAVAAKVKEFKDRVARKIRENLEIAAEIARVQLEAAQRIDERSRVLPIGRSAAN